MLSLSSYLVVMMMMMMTLYMGDDGDEADGDDGDAKPDQQQMAGQGLICCRSRHRRKLGNSLCIK